MPTETKETAWIGNWYEIHQLEEGVIAIGEPKHQEEVFCYFLKGKDQDLLIDTGMGIVPITNVLEKIRSVTKPLIVVNTHYHFDHIGGNSHFKNVLVPKNRDEVAGMLHGWSQEELAKYGFAKGFHQTDGTNNTPNGFDSSKFVIAPYRNIDPVLINGYQIDLGDRVLEVIETPGHTPGGISLFDTTNGLLFTSDLLYEGPLYSFENESDPKKYLSSLQKIKRKFGTKIKRIHPGHNYPENTHEPNLLEDAIKLLKMAVKKQAPDDPSLDFPGAVEYSCPGISSRTGTSRRLKVLVNQNFVS